MFYFIIPFVLIAFVCAWCILRFSEDEDDFLDEYSEKDEWDNFFGH